MSWLGERMACRRSLGIAEEPSEYATIPAAALAPTPALEPGGTAYGVPTRKRRREEKKAARRARRAERKEARKDTDDEEDEFPWGLTAAAAAAWLLFK